MVRLHDRAVHVVAAAALALACLVAQPGAAQDATTEAPIQQPEAAPQPPVQPAEPAARFRTFLQTFRAEAVAAGLVDRLLVRA